MRRAKKTKKSPERQPKIIRMTAAERRRKVERAAGDFAARFERVMRELAEE